MVCNTLYIVLLRTSAAVDMMYTNQKHTEKLKYIKINTQKKKKKRKKQQINKTLLYEDYVTQTVHRVRNMHSMDTKIT